MNAPALPCGWIECPNTVDPGDETPFCSASCLSAWWAREIDLAEAHETHWTEVA